MIRIYPSEDGFDTIYQLVNDIAVATNPQLLYHLQDVTIEEKLEVIEVLKKELGDIIG